MVQRAGPWFPAEPTQTTPYLLITSFISSPIRLGKESQAENTLISQQY
jgi:hypothetical protein